MENLTSPLTLDAAREELAAAGYRGERVVLLMPTDVPRFKSLAEVTADLLRKLGMNVELRSMDMATVVQRRVKRSRWTGADGASSAPSSPGSISSIRRCMRFCAAMAATAPRLANQHADRGVARRVVRRRRPDRAERRRPSNCNDRRSRTCPIFRLANGTSRPRIAPISRRRRPDYRRLEHQTRLTYVACGVVIHYLIVSAYY